jgi:hypothetical protein
MSLVKNIQTRPGKPLPWKYHIADSKKASITEAFYIYTRRKSYYSNPFAILLISKIALVSALLPSSLIDIDWPKAKVEMNRAAVSHFHLIKLLFLMLYGQRFIVL